MLTSVDRAAYRCLLDNPDHTFAQLDGVAGRYDEQRLRSQFFLRCGFRIGCNRTMGIVYRQRLCLYCLQRFRLVQMNR